MSFHQCTDLKEWADSIPESPIVWYDEYERELTRFVYPEYTAQRILQLYKNNDYRTLAKVLEALGAENYTKRTLSRIEHEQLLAQLHDTLMQCMYTQDRRHRLPDEEQNYLYLLSQLSDQQGFSSMMDRFVSQCQARSEKRENTNNETIQNIKQYIEDHFSAPDLSLQSMADYFHLNEVYFSAFFKKHIGVNFSIYVERRRLEEAIRMLRLGSMTVAAIAEKVGYTSVSSFRRAFKRVMNQSPTDYIYTGTNTP